MAFTFPSSPSTGTLFTAPSGVMYVWDGSWTTMGDTQASNPFSNSFLYRSIYTKGYMNGGYKSGSPWYNVNKTIHATDMTTNLGDKLTYNSSYVGGGFSDYRSYIYPSTGAVGGSGTIVESMNMANDTMLTIACGLFATRIAHARNATVPMENVTMFQGCIEGPIAFSV